MTKHGPRKKRQFLDDYQTPSEAITPLLERLRLSGVFWEPFAGVGNISSAIKATGNVVISYDLFDRGFRLDRQVDFFELNRQDIPVFDHVISNPPYGGRNALIMPVVKRLLEFRPRHGVIALLLPSEYDHGSTRSEIFRSPFYRGQIKICDRIPWFETEEKTKGTENHTWHIWGHSTYTWPARRLLPVVDYMRLAK